MSRNAKTDPRHDFLPARESDLVAWSRAFRDKIVANPPQFGLTQQQADDYSVLHDAFAEAYTTAINPSTNCRSAIVAKNDAKKALKAEARTLARIILATPGVTLEQRSTLGLTIPDSHLTPDRAAG